MKKFFRNILALLKRLFALVIWLVTLPWRVYRRGRDFLFSVPDETSVTETLGNVFNDRDTFREVLQGVGEHLQVLRMHLLRSVIALALTTAFSFTFVEKLVAVLTIPVGLAEQNQTVDWFDFWKLTQEALTIGEQGMSKLQVIEPTEAVGVFMRVSLLSGVVFAMPWLVLELYLFIAPGLMPRSRILLLWIIPAASGLFLTGVAFTYFVMLPAAVPFLLNFMGFRAAWRPAAYFDLITNLMFWVGVAFQMPLIVYGLASVGLVRASQLAAQWRIAIVLISIVAAVITPTVDPVNMALVMLPMTLLYGLSIIGAAVAGAGYRRRKRAQEARA